MLGVGRDISLTFEAPTIRSHEHVCVSLKERDTIARVSLAKICECIGWNCVDGLIHMYVCVFLFSRTQKVLRLAQHPVAYE